MKWHLISTEWTIFLQLKECPWNSLVFICILYNTINFFNVQQIKFENFRYFWYSASTPCHMTLHSSSTYTVPLVLVEGVIKGHTLTPRKSTTENVWLWSSEIFWGVKVSLRHLELFVMENFSFLTNQKLLLLYKLHLYKWK